MSANQHDDLEPVYPLAEAVKLFLPGGHWTVNSLRTEIRKGRLVPERIAGKLGVTRRAIMEMRERCREEKREAPASCSDAGRAASPCGSSGDADLKLARAATKQTLQALKRNSRNSRQIRSARLRGFGETL